LEARAGTGNAGGGNAAALAAAGVVAAIWLARHAAYLAKKHCCSWDWDGLPRSLSLSLGFLDHLSLF
jgi:hypothetical protein